MSLKTIIKDILTILLCIVVGFSFLKSLIPLFPKEIKYSVGVITYEITDANITDPYEKWDLLKTFTFRVYYLKTENKIIKGELDLIFMNRIIKTKFIGSYFPSTVNQGCLLAYTEEVVTHPKFSNFEIISQVMKRENLIPSSVFYQKIAVIRNYYNDNYPTGLKRENKI
jgi:hypothetical protein